jgi:hypothetical protein
MEITTMAGVVQTEATRTKSVIEGIPKECLATVAAGKGLDVVADQAMQKASQVVITKQAAAAEINEQANKAQEALPSTDGTKTGRAATVMAAGSDAGTAGQTANAAEVKALYASCEQQGPALQQAVGQDQTRLNSIQKQTQAKACEDYYTNSLNVAKDQLCKSIDQLAYAAGVNATEFGAIGKAANSIGNAAKGLSGSGIPTAIGAGLLGAALGGVAGYVAGQQNGNNGNDGGDQTDPVSQPPVVEPTATPTPTTTPTPTRTPTGSSVTPGTPNAPTSGGDNQLTGTGQQPTPQGVNTTLNGDQLPSSTKTPPSSGNPSGSNRDVATTSSVKGPSSGSSTTGGGVTRSPTGGSGTEPGGSNRDASLSLSSTGTGGGSIASSNGESFVGFDINSFGANINGTRSPAGSKVQVQKGGRAKATIDLNAFCAKNPKHSRCSIKGDPLLQ